MLSYLHLALWVSTGVCTVSLDLTFCPSLTSKSTDYFLVPCPSLPSIHYARVSVDGDGKQSRQRRYLVVRL